MDIVFSANNFEEMVQLPIIPPDFSLPFNQRKNEEFETIQMGALNLAGLRGLKHWTIQSFFPTKEYSFAKSKISGWECVNFFNNWANKRLPIRVIVTTDSGIEMLNMPCLVENFTYGLDRAGDIPYTLDIKEFRFVEVT
ncbi:hypothetical protein [Paenibacillus sp. Root444D2]|uniref:hypothetical protein n=1 Tax=Paenibacillus sp. Root444D2 TaxID=1736538 RepID=UPI00070DC104|nr:hypothetical protein [Paenibacillus sp. Root444D2]KQX69226.1 hypothetical protein ASD40_01630 [Paenibacillus sp. Root444D2]